MRNRSPTPTDRLELDWPALNAFTAPIALITDDGRLVAANTLFSSEAGLLDAAGADLSPAVRTCLDTVIMQKRTARCSVQGVSEVNIFDLTALPLAGRSALWLLLAGDVTVDVSLRNALVESRARYMDIVALSGETAWETGADGSFTIVTPRGMAGYETGQLVGQDPVLLLDPTRATPTVLPFRTPLPLTAVDLWVRHADGHSVCFEISAVPLYSEDGAWRGARGICRDVTEDRNNQTFLAELRNNERLLSRITDVFRQKSVPDDMLMAAAEASTHGLAASGCQIFVTTGRAGTGDSSLTCVASVGRCGEIEAIEPLLVAMTGDPGRRVRQASLEDWSVLVAPTIYGGWLIGAIILWRSAVQPPWADRDAELTGTLAGHLAAAIEQRADYHRLLAASRTDPLTGLLNRRAFDEETNRRLQRLARGGKTAALLYFDLDNFKAVNDLRGHATGDEALRHVADILRSNTRSTDLVARLGGDEFAVWLDDVAEPDAVKRVKTFLAAAASLSRYDGDAERPLRVSVGVALHDPEMPETMATLAKRADAALYRIKRAGKASFALAPPPRTKR